MFCFFIMILPNIIFDVAWITKIVYILPAMLQVQWQAIAVELLKNSEFCGHYKFL